MASYVSSLARAAGNLGLDAFQAALPHALQAVQYVPALRSAMHGTAIIIAGGTLAYQCGLVEIVKNRCFRTAPSAPPPPLTAVRILGMGAGVVLVCFGIYHIATNGAEVWHYAHSTDPTDVHPLYARPTAQDKETAKKVIAKLQECPTVNSLWENVQQAGQIFPARLFR